VSTSIPPRPDTGARVSLAPADARVRSTWGWFEAVGVYFLAFLGGGLATIPIILALGDTTVGGAIGRSEIIATIVADVVITGILVVWLTRWHAEWRAAMVFPERSRLGRHLLFGAIAGAILVPAAGLVSLGLQVLFQQVAGRDVTTPEQVAPGLSPSATVLLVLLAVIVAPISEEFFFRGVLFRTVRDRHGFWPAAFASAIPFGLVHYVPAPAVDALLLQVTMVFTGLGLAWVYERRGTVVAPAAAHIVFNVVGVVTILAVAR
jgi:membrane protease YdiL (CAAX protease family)